jgi:opacity protein-like surface antigen
MKKIFGLMLLSGLMLIVNTATAQLKLKIGYNVSVPVGSFRDVMDPSYRGAMGEINYAITPAIKVGLGVSYNDFYKRMPRQVYNTDGGTVSAVVTNSMQITPVMAKGTYSFITTGMIRPYVSIGGGLNMVDYSQYLGEFGSSRTLVKAAAGAEAGVDVPFSRTGNAGINIGAHFNYLPLNFNGMDNLNNWGGHVAVFFPLH